MKRFKIVGLCLVAVFAFSAVAVSSASAGSLGVCGKAAKVGKSYTGKFSDKLCATAEPKGEGKYEFTPNAGNIAFTSEGGPSHLKGAAGEIACERGTDSGTYEGAKKILTCSCSLGASSNHSNSSAKATAPKKAKSSPTRWRAQ